MLTSHSSTRAPTSSPGQFAVTRWTLIAAAGQGESAETQEALEQLCRSYWQPIYAFIRREGHGPADAQDLTQEFFARFLAKKYLAGVDPAKGRFRSFLLATLKHFLANEWDKARAQKRGGNRVLVPIDAAAAEHGLALAAEGQLSPDRAYDRRWALTLLQLIMTRLRVEYEGDGKAGLFEELKSTLTGERRSVPYTEIAARLGMSEGAVKVAVHRLRRRYRELLRAEIARTVCSAEDVDDELRALFGALEN